MGPRMQFCEPMPSPPRPSNGIEAVSRRQFLTGAAIVGGSLVITGAIPAQAEAADIVLDGFNGLAAFVVPGNDRFSKQQRLTTSRPGGVDNGSARIVRRTLDAAIPVPLGETDVPVPGALAYALLLKAYAINVNALSIVGPFANPFANLTWTQKREALIRLDAAPPLEGTQITFAGNALITLAAFGAYTEGTAYNRKERRLTRQPVGWQLSQYQGVSDGHPDLIGYYQGRTEVTG